MLDMTALGLQAKGFKQKCLNEKVTYEKPITNGAFVFNPLEKIYRWYHVTTIGDASNWTHLKIENVEQLDLILKTFSCA